MSKPWLYGKVPGIGIGKLKLAKSNPKNFIYYVESNTNDKIVEILPYNNNDKIIITSKLGKGFIADLNDIITSQKKGKQLFNLKSNDEVLSINNIIGDHIACVNSSSKLLIFKIDQLPVLKKGGGVQLQKIKNNEFLSDIQIFHLSDGISWRTGSKTKNEKNINFWIGKRSQSGKKIPKRFNKELKFNNP